MSGLSLVRFWSNNKKISWRPDMTDKSAEYARETLNALIAGGCIPGLTQSRAGEAVPRLDVEILRGLEKRLREYYSTGPYAQKNEANPIEMRY